MKYSVGRRGPDCWHEPDLVLIVSVQRGRCHSYWVPDVWALCTFLDKGSKLRGAAHCVTAGVYSADVCHDDAGVTELSRAREGNSAGLHREIATISLFPLLFTPVEQGSKGLLGTCHAVLAEVVLVPLLEQPLKERHIKSPPLHFRKLDAVKSYVDAQRPK
ncbi:unnamed protein product [Peronospora farinosa]|uniref:Uncharacterized protein n=1 Tax=Peronospora farinosa TaxID=134698 RepID=A0ABN8C1G9_9STRA|nr:unnamed protein product [Peronospora farinosa]